MTETPYREQPAEKPVELLTTPLTEFKKHEKALAFLRIYRQDIVECVEDPEVLNELKDRANSCFLERTSLADRTNNSPTHLAVVWVNQLTLDDLDAFEEEEDERVEGPFARRESESKAKPEELVTTHKGFIQRTWKSWALVLVGFVGAEWVLHHCSLVYGVQ